MLIHSSHISLRHHKQRKGKPWYLRRSKCSQLTLRTLLDGVGIRDVCFERATLSRTPALPKKLIMYRFKRAFYANPDREDLNALWWDLVEEIQLVDHPLDRDEPDWGAKIHVAIAPVYYHNYVLGHLTAAQLRDYLEKPVVGSPF